MTTTTTTYLLLDMTKPTQPRQVGEYATRREAHREALRLNLRGYQVKAA